MSTTTTTIPTTTPTTTTTLTTTTQAKILLDVRERELILLMPSHPTQQLHVGDAWIGDPEANECAVVVERKTIADLESSLTDGRYREQRTRLLAFCAEKKARPLYIIEGDIDKSRSNKKNILWQVLNRLCLRYGVGLMRTNSTRETAELLETIAYQLSEDKECFKATTLSYTDVASFQKKANKDDPENFTLAVLQQCTGVSVDKAKSLLNNFKSLKGIMEADAPSLAEVKTATGRKMGPALAKRLYDHFHFVKI